MSGHRNREAPQGLQSISTAAFSAKFKSKKEVFRFLSSEVCAYLPSYETVTIWHLRDLVMGAKTIINNDDVKNISIPQYEGLTIADMYQWIQDKAEVLSALPPEKETSKMSRAYIANVIYTKVGQPFKDWVNAQVDARNEKVAIEGDNVISMDPRIAEIFLNSTAISVSKGRSSHLMKASAKRRRSRAQILEDRDRERQKQQQIRSQLERMETLRMDMISKDSEIDRLQNEQRNFDSMFEQGILYRDDNGKIDFAKDDQQRQYLAEMATGQKMMDPNIRLPGQFVLSTPLPKENLQFKFDNAGSQGNEEDMQ